VDKNSLSAGEKGEEGEGHWQGCPNERIEKTTTIWKAGEESDAHQLTKETVGSGKTQGRKRLNEKTRQGWSTREGKGGRTRHVEVIFGGTSTEKGTLSPHGLPENSREPAPRGGGNSTGRDAACEDVAGQRNF